ARRARALGRWSAAARLVALLVASGIRPADLGWTRGAADTRTLARGRDRNPAVRPERRPKAGVEGPGRDAIARTCASTPRPAAAALSASGNFSCASCDRKRSVADTRAASCRDPTPSVRPERRPKAGVEGPGRDAIARTCAST